MSEKLRRAGEDLTELEGKQIELLREKTRLNTHKQVQKLLKSGKISKTQRHFDFNKWYRKKRAVLDRTGLRFGLPAAYWSQRQHCIHKTFYLLNVVKTFSSCLVRTYFHLRIYWVFFFVGLFTGIPEKIALVASYLALFTVHDTMVQSNGDTLTWVYTVFVFRTFLFIFFCVFASPWKSMRFFVRILMCSYPH